MPLYSPSTAGGAPTDVAYVVGASDASLSGELVLGTAVNMSGLLAARPAPGTAGRTYYVTDDDGGTLFRDTGVSWVAIAPGITEAPANHATRHMPGGADAWTKLARKTANESVTSSTTLQADNDLFFAIAANEVWLWDALLLFDAPVAGDAKIQWDGPAGASAVWGSHGPKTGDDTSIGNIAVKGAGLGTGESLPFGTMGAGVTATVLVKGIVTNGATPGTFELLWSQNTINGTATILKAGSFLYAIRIA